jgi:hypothetical protein
MDEAKYVFSKWKTRWLVEWEVTDSQILALYYKPEGIMKWKCHSKRSHKARTDFGLIGEGQKKKREIFSFLTKHIALSEWYF